MLNGEAIYLSHKNFVKIKRVNIYKENLAIANAVEIFSAIYVYKSLCAFNNLYDLEAQYYLISLGINFLMDTLNFY